MAFSIVVVEGKRSGSEVTLEGREFFVIGNGPDAHLSLPDEGVLPDHFRIFRDGERLLLMATGDGVPVNGTPQQQAELKAGDIVAAGKALLKVVDAAPPSVSQSGVMRRSNNSSELVVLKGPDEGKHFKLEKRITLGRGTSADVPLLDMKCSREHCAVEKMGESWALVDLGSTNGTKLNEVRVEAKTPTRLRTGDRIKLGATLLEFRGPEPAPARPAFSPTKTPPPAAMGAKPFEIDLGDLDATPPAIPVPADDAAQRGAVTQRLRPSGILKKGAPSSGATSKPATLAGDLEKMGFAQVVQFLNLQAKTGELIVHAAAGEFGLAFASGNVTDAWGPGPAGELAGEEAFYAIARLSKGHFELHETPSARPARIKQGTLALLMEAMRLVDEATNPGD